MGWSLTNPPSWAPDAVATPSGWADPITGELLVAIRGLSTKNAGPSVVRVTRVGSKFRFGVGDVISFRVKFNEVVTVTGTPQITMNLDQSAEVLSYVSGSGTSTLIFSYTVQALDAAAAGEVVLESPILLNSGTIKDALNTNAVLTFTVPNTSQMVVDTVAPAIDSVAAPVQTAFVTGDTFTLTVTMDEPCLVTASPYIAMTVGGVAKNAVYESGSGTAELLFSYTVAADDSADASEVVIVGTSGAITLGVGGAITDLAGNDVADLTFTKPTVSGVSFNSTAAPTIVSVAAPSGGTLFSANGTANMDFVATFSKAVVVTGTPQITIGINGVAKTANYLSGSGSNQLTFRYTVVSADAATAGQFTVSSPLVLNSGTIKDVYDTALTPLTFTPPTVSSVVIDNAAPTISSITLPADGNYDTGEAVSFTVVFSQAVTVVNSPRLVLTVGDVTRYAYYASGSGTTNIVFTYVPGASDVAALGEFEVSSPINMNGGTIKDAAMNNAVVTFDPQNVAAISINS